MKHIVPYILAALLGLASTPLLGQGNTGGQPDPNQMQSKAIPSPNAQRKVNIATLVTRKEQQIDDLVLQYRRSGPDSKQRVRQDIEQALRQLFELKLRQREQALRDLEAEIQEVQQSLEKNRRNKEAIVQKRLEALLGKQ